MQIYGNVATTPERVKSKSSGKIFIQFRLAESQKGIDTAPSFYTVRLMKDQETLFKTGEFVKVTGKLKVDFYMSREGKPSGTLLVIAFDASTVARPSELRDVVKDAATAPPTARAEPTAKELKPVPSLSGPPPSIPVPQTKQVKEAAEQCESDWSTLYD